MRRPPAIPLHAKRWWFIAACMVPFALLGLWSALLMRSARAAQHGLDHCAVWTLEIGRTLEAFEDLNLKASRLMEAPSLTAGTSSVESAKEALRDARQELGRRTSWESDLRLDALDQALKEDLDQLDQVQTALLAREKPKTGPEKAEASNAIKAALAHLDHRHRGAQGAFRNLIDTIGRSWNSDPGQPAKHRSARAFLDEFLVIALALGAAGCVALWSKLRADALARFDQTLVDTIPDGVLAWGEDGRVLVVNPALGRIVGPVNHAFTPGMTIGDLLPPDPRKRLEESDPGDYVVFNLHQPSGKLLAIEATAGSVQTPTGSVHLAVLRNSTRSVESERRFLESERLAVIGRNTASICRDLQRLFRPIPLAVEMLKPEAKGRRRGDGTWEELERSVKDTGDLLRQMNQFARAGRLDEESTAFDMHACVQETVEAFYSQGVPLGSLSLDLSTVPALVVGPREKFMAALKFLLERALDATGGGPIVRVRTWDEEEVHVIEVADSGDAIPDTQMASVFDPVFFTSMEAPESGFGLFNVAATIRELHGSIRADRLKGGWTRFLIQIPRGR